MISTAGKEGGTRERGRRGPGERRGRPAGRHNTRTRALHGQAGGRTAGAGDATGVFSEHVSNGGPRIIWSAPGCPVASEQCSAVPPPTADGSLKPLRPSGRGQTVIATERGRLPPFPLFSRMGNVSGRLLQNKVGSTFSFHPARPAFPLRPSRAATEIARPLVWHSRSHSVSCHSPAAPSLSDSPSRLRRRHQNDGNFVLIEMSPLSPHALSC